MGWARGSEIFETIAHVLMQEVDDDDARATIYENMVDIFEDADCDTLDEVAGIDPILDLVLEEHGYIEGDEGDE